jgi:hypothetical protein
MLEKATHWRIKYEICSTKSTADADDPFDHHLHLLCIGKDAAPSGT